MAQTFDSVQDELTRRHRAALLVVGAELAFTLLLMALAVSGVVATTPRPNPAVDGALRIGIVFFGLGAVALRRTKFNAARLRDIAALRGTSGLLETLQKTTIYVAALGGAIATMGFVISLLSGEGRDMMWIGIIAIAVLLYGYPRRAAWERVVEATRGADAAGGPAAKGTIA